VTVPPEPEDTSGSGDEVRAGLRTGDDTAIGEPAPAAAPGEDAASADGPGEEPARARAAPRRLAVATAIFAVATGFSRVAGLVREVVAASYYGTTGAASAFTFAFQLPNLIRALVADAALSSAFVPVFSELMEKRQRAQAAALASSLFGLILVVLGVLTLVCILLAGELIPPLTGDKFTPALDSLTVGLTRVLFPIVVLLGLNGLVVGILNAHDHFSVPAIAPLVWNLVIIAALVALTPLFEGDDRIYAYAIGVLAGTVVQFAMCLPVLKRVGFSLGFSLDLRDPRIIRVLKLMLPVSIGLGLINVNLLINTLLGSLISEEASSAIDKAFRIYMLPQGMFSVAVATVLFPSLSRLASRRDFAGLRAITGRGTRLIAILLIPSAAATAVLATPITRLVFQYGAFDEDSTRQTAEALVAFSFSLPFSGINLLLTRTFFSLQRPWMPTKLAGITLLINVAVSVALYRPLGIAGIVLGTVASTAAMAVLQARFLRREIGGLELRRSLVALGQMLLAALVLAGVAYATWWAVDAAAGRSLLAQIASVGLGLTAGSLVYAAVVLLLRIPEAREIIDLFAARLGRRRGGGAPPAS
jgi:putative peptidoglycan lipid II flippase